MPFVSINNIVHHYVTAGAKDKPALVFSNSLGSDLRIWDEVSDRLSLSSRPSTQAGVIDGPPRNAKVLESMHPTDNRKAER